MLVLGGVFSLPLSYLTSHWWSNTSTVWLNLPLDLLPPSSVLPFGFIFRKTFQSLSHEEAQVSLHWEGKELGLTADSQHWLPQIGVSHLSNESKNQPQHLQVPDNDPIQTAILKNSWSVKNDYFRLLTSGEILYLAVVIINSLKH